MKAEKEIIKAYLTEQIAKYREGLEYWKDEQKKADNSRRFSVCQENVIYHNTMINSLGYMVSELN